MVSRVIHAINLALNVSISVVCGAYATATGGDSKVGIEVTAGLGVTDVSLCHNPLKGPVGVNGVMRE